MFPGRDSLACEAVDVNLQAFLAKSLTVRIVPDAIVTNSVNEEEQGRDIQLIKRMQLGLEVALKVRMESVLNPCSGPKGSGDGTGAVQWQVRECHLRDQGGPGVRQHRRGKVAPRPTPRPRAASPTAWSHV